MDFFEPFLDLVFPRTCAGCGRPVEGLAERHVCWDCRAAIPVITDPFCSVCGDPVDGEVEHDYVCSFCRDRRPHFDLARSAVRFRGPLKDIIHALKYGHASCLVRDLAPYLAACVRTCYPRVLADAVTFVPLYPRRERERTYNQSALLSRRLAALLGLPYLPSALRRVRDTSTQTHLDSHARRLNVRGAFVAVNERWLRGRQILLVDDVMTTGATVDECARTLKDAGAAGVFVVTVARG